MSGVRIDAWVAPPTADATPADLAAIQTTILDYFEGWFDGDVQRVERALHPGLAKHALGQDATHSETLDLTTKAEMVAATERGVGRSRDTADRAIAIDIVDVSGDIASVIVHSAVYIEYALLARTATGWKVTGTLWRWAPGHGPRA